MDGRNNEVNTAHLIEYLMDEARKTAQPSKFELQLVPENGRIALRFPTWKATPLPKEPPERYTPERWGRALAKTTGRETGSEPLMTYWSWEPDDGYTWGDAVSLIQELVRFSPEPVSFVGTMWAAGGQDPLQAGATGLAEDLDDQVTVLLVTEAGDARGNWAGDRFDHRTMRPNIIYPNGIARCSREIHRHGDTSIYAGRLKDDELRGPAHEVKLETRVLVTAKQNRNRMRHPHLSGLNETTTSRVCEVAQRLIKEWLARGRREGYCYGHGNHGENALHPDMRIMTNNHWRSYGAAGPVVARHPARLHDQNKVNQTLEESLKQAIIHCTIYTLGESRQTDIQTTVTVDRIVVTNEAGEEHDVDLRNGTYQDDSRKPADEPWVIRARNALALLSINSPSRDEERLAVPMPLIATRRIASHGTTLVVTDQARETLSREQVMSFIKANPQSWRDTGEVQADLALEDTTTAYINETRRMLKAYRPLSGMPTEPVIIRADRNGYTVMRERE